MEDLNNFWLNIIIDFMFIFHHVEKSVKESIYFLLDEGTNNKKTLSYLINTSGDKRKKQKIISISSNHKKNIKMMKMNILCQMNGFKTIYEIKLNKLKTSFKEVFRNKFSNIKEDVYYGKISTINYKILSRSGFFRRRCS